MFNKAQNHISPARWNKGKLIGQKSPLSMQDIWSIRLNLQNEGRLRDLAMFNLALDSKLSACDLLNLRVSDVSNGDRVNNRATVMQQKTSGPCVSRLLENPESQSMTGSSALAWEARIISSRAGFGSHSTCRRGSTPGWSLLGWPLLVLTQPLTARTRCAEQRRPCSIAGPRTSGPFNYCWGTQSWIVR